MTDRGNRPLACRTPWSPRSTKACGGRRADQLAVQRCQDCVAHRYPPGDGCYRCSSCRWEWSMLPGTGVVYSYVWIPDRSRVAAGDEAAYSNVVIVTLDGTEGEPVRILSNVVNAWGRRDLHVGQTVE